MAASWRWISWRFVGIYAIVFLSMREGNLNKWKNSFTQNHWWERGEQPNDLRPWSHKGYACGSNKLRINKKPVSLYLFQFRLKQKIWTAHVYWDGHENVEEGECHSWHGPTFKITNFGTQCSLKEVLQGFVLGHLKSKVSMVFSNGFASKCPSFEASSAVPLGRTSRLKPAGSEWKNATGKKCTSP